MKKKERYDLILGHFREKMPLVTTELDFGSTFQLLVAVVLSAQCTDKRINQVTPDLFAHYPDAQSMAKAEEEDIFEWIRSVSYPNAKAKHLVEMALTKYIPEEDIPNAHHWLLLHGRYVCTARKPHCEKCEIEKYCAKIIS